MGRLGVVVLLVVVGVCQVRASNHLIALEEVLGSWQGDDTVQFVELRMLAAGQQELGDAGGARGGTALVFDDATASEAGRRVFRFTHNVTSGLINARILVASPGLTALSGLTADFVLPPGMLAPRAGRVCYVVDPPQEPGQTTGVIDCVAYGRFTGENGRFGTPTPITPDNRAIQRVALGNFNIDDWASALEPTPQNNAGAGVLLPTLCGDGAISQGEDCDGLLLGGNTCAALGFASGNLRCTECHFNTRNCSFCGNNAINGEEQCDGTDLGGRTCVTLGFTGGTLDCTDTCHLSTVNCDPTFLVPGGGRPGPECLAMWLVMNSTARPGADGRAPVRQRCLDGDPGCDTDTAVGTCTFSVGVCLDRQDARLARDGRPCRIAPIESWALLAPPAEGDVAGLVTAVALLGPSTTASSTVTFAPPLTARERCTEPLSIVVPTRGRRPGKLVLRARTTASGGRPRDPDTLKLVCVP